MTFASAVLTLFLVMDPLGNIPLFIPVLKDIPEEKRKRIVRRELIFAFIALIAFQFLGKYFLSYLEIDRASLGIAGGIVLFLISIQMIFPTRDLGLAENPGGEPFIVPLAIPLVAGPSAMTTVLILANSESAPKLFAAITTAWILNAAILMLAFPISRILGRRGMIAVGRLMGMILTTVAVQMFMNGVAQFLGK